MSVAHLQNTFLWKASIYVGVSLHVACVWCSTCPGVCVSYYNI